MNKNHSLLVVDDERNMRESLKTVLESRGYQGATVESAEDGLKAVKESDFFMVITDARLEGMSGYDFLRETHERWPDLPVLMITAYATPKLAVQAIQTGAIDYLSKPFEPEELLHSVNRCAERHELIRQNEKLKERLPCGYQLDDIIGNCQSLKDLREMIRTVGPTEATILILGESGTGKELIARAIHDGGPRHDGPFLPLNCAALPRELAESLLFGHVKGAFTGASESRAGCFEAAHGGTLFLDEIGEMPQDQQAKLLRVLEDGQVWRVGATTARTVDVRVVAATNIDLQARISEGGFRQDLFYRLARFTVTAPPLRERPDDIPLLAEHFARAFAADMGREPAALTDETVTALRTYGFPGGNVRELKNVIERALLECGGGAVIEPGHLRFAGGQAAPVPGGDGASKAGPELPLHDLDEAIAETEKWVVARALAESGGNVSAATRLLGTNRNRMYRILGQKRDEADEGDAG